MGMEMEMKQASNKNAQTPKWEWGDGGGISHGIISILLYIIKLIHHRHRLRCPYPPFFYMGPRHTLHSWHCTIPFCTIKHKDYMP
mmetsp:Transcript_8104/g.12103  ORF Transcript_8104/g.12103 Transcript_8104/m.12103 type:complete len:85 (+) Transcript_8104:455-709(+)